MAGNSTAEESDEESDTDDEHAKKRHKTSTYKQWNGT
jgi:hypothetical protein